MVRTVKTRAARAARRYAFTWNGRNDAGAYVARGSSRSEVHATGGTLASTQTASVVTDAFRITVSDTTPARRQRITVTATSAEALSTIPRLVVYQPGITHWTVTPTKVSTGVHRATITLKSSSTGTGRLRVGAYDTGHLGQTSTLSLPLH